MSVLSDNDTCSFQSNEEIHDTTIGMTITEYYISGNGNDFNDHRFICEVKCEALTFYVDRSYIDFVELDRRIRKTYPQSRIDPLPLDGYQMIKKIINDRNVIVKRRSSLGIKNIPKNRDALNGIPDADHIKIHRKGSDFENETLAAKIKELNLYLRALLSHHELVASEELLLFVDEEAASMAVDPASLHPLSVHDILLLNEAPVKLNVSKRETITFNAPAGHLIIWRFSTEKYDIGFSVEMDDEVKVAYTRYKSNIRPVCGTLEVTQPSVCKVKFDNSYAKLHSKTVTYTIRVVETTEYDKARDQALDVQREKKKFENQRHALKRCACKHGALLSGVHHSSSVVHDHAAEQAQKVNDLMLELESIKKLNEVYQYDYESLNLEMQEMEQNHQAMSEAKDKITESWRFAINQLDNCRNELKELKTNHSEIMQQNKKYIENNATLVEENQKMIENQLVLNEQYDSKITDLHNEILNLTNIIEMNDILKQQHIEKIESQHEHTLLELKNKFETDTERIKLDYEELINRMKIEVEEQFQEMNQCIDELEDKNSKINKEMNDMKQTKEDTLMQLNTLQDRYDILIKEKENLEKEKLEMNLVVQESDKKIAELEEKLENYEIKFRNIDANLQCFREKDKEIQHCVSQVVAPMENLIKTINSPPASPVRSRRRQENVIFDDIPELFPETKPVSKDEPHQDYIYSDIVGNNTKIKVKNTIPFEEDSRKNEKKDSRSSIRSSLALFKLGSNSSSRSGKNIAKKENNT